MLLQRLNGDQTLQDRPNIDEACTIIGTILATLSAAPVPVPVPVPPEVPALGTEVQRIAESIDSNRATHPDVLAASVVDRALATLRELVQDLRARTQRGLVHGDCHFLNVLHTPPGKVPEWVAIDPLPTAGVPEWDVTALLRNRWDDAAATQAPRRRAAAQGRSGHRNRRDGSRTSARDRTSRRGRQPVVAAAARATTHVRAAVSGDQRLVSPPLRKGVTGAQVRPKHP